MAQVLEIGSGVKIEPFTVIEGGGGKENNSEHHVETPEGISTEMECLYTTGEILAIMCLKHELIMLHLSVKNVMH